uniref:Uncharacterized protein n=1 Tax=Anguilla anguilla TaxID=7936 RepID=A0A0E9UDK5_ANGAN
MSTLKYPTWSLCHKRKT